MGVLLRTDRKIQRLERKGTAPVQLTEQIDDLLVGGDGANILILFPRILDTPFADRLVAVRAVEIDAITRAKTGLDPVDPRFDVGVRKIENRIAFSCRSAAIRASSSVKPCDMASVGKSGDSISGKPGKILVKTL
jgi:hypothetical protein